MKKTQYFDIIPKKDWFNLTCYLLVSIVFLIPLLVVGIAFFVSAIAFGIVLLAWVGFTYPFVEFKPRKPKGP